MMALRSSPPGGAGLAAAPPNTVESDSHGTGASISILARFSSALFARTTHPPAVCGTGGGGGVVKSGFLPVSVRFSEFMRIVVGTTNEGHFKR